MKTLHLPVENKCASGSHNLLIHLSRPLAFHSQRVFYLLATFSLDWRQFLGRDGAQFCAGAPNAPLVTRNSLAKCKIKVSNELKVIVHVNISSAGRILYRACAGARQQNKSMSDTQDTTRRRGRGGLLSYVLVCSLLLRMATSMEDLIKSGSWFIVVRARGVGCLAHMLRAMQAGEWRERESESERLRGCLDAASTYIWKGFR